MNTTEATPGDVAAEPREGSSEGSRPETSEAASGGVRDVAAGAGGDGMPQSEHGLGPPQPRRRRRRRRKPVPGMLTTGPAVAGEAGDVPEVPVGANGSAEPSSPEGGAEPGSEDGTPGRGILRLRNRRRRRRPHAPGLAPGPAPGPADATAAAEGTAEGASASEGGAPPANPFRAPRRRRRHAPLSVARGDAPGAASGNAASGSEATPGTRPPRSRNRRRRRAAPGEATGASGDRQPREQRPAGENGPDSRERRGGARQDSGERNDGRRDAGPRGDRRRDDRRGGGPGRGRGAGAPRQVERKLYSTDAIVDRGFDDMEEDGETRRVHWTILKRTTADQVSRKAISAVYVLQRDGEDTEFPNLGAARSAVNKTIVHPEKLTLSKAEHAAAKK